ncbi:AAA family ATPase [Micromonospora sp. NPDC049230]|uniref:NACHT and WD repeat domain-containing protein n=1 Tax=Micromonospora sp. NPDC049230 TaxID=3155502 RepID=UPI0033CF4CCC
MLTDSEPDPDPRTAAGVEDFVTALKALRHGSGHSIRDLAQMVTAHDIAHTVSASTLGGWFTGAHLPTRKLTSAFVSLLVVLGVRDENRIAVWLAALDRVRAQPGPRSAEAPSPFRGLTTYEVEHARFFQGRDDLVAELLATVRRRQQHGGPVMVVGPSGSGKSSLLRAGLIPAWSTAHLLFTPGERPLRALAGHLAARAGQNPGDLYDRLRMNPATARTVLGESDGASLIIVVDQAEEMFTLCADRVERIAFVDALHTVTAAVVYGLRADFFTQAMRLPTLTEVLRHGQVVVGPMTEAELRHAIVQPARLAQLTVQPELVEVLLRDLAPRQTLDGRAGHDPGALPLLSHALLMTWRQASGRTLTVEHYRATGGIRGAITQTAEDAYAALPGEVERDAARRLFLRLVHTDDETVDTRRRVARADLLSTSDRDEVEQVVQRFAAARLLTVDGDTVEIAHEALLWSWPRMREWLDANRTWLRFHRPLAAAAQHWEETGRSLDGLYRGGILQLAQEQVEGHRDQLSGAERAFLETSLRHSESQRAAERRRARRRLQLVAAVVVFGLLAASVLGYAVEVRLARSAEQARSAFAAAQSTSRQIAVKADRMREQDMPLAQLLALAAYRASPTPEARSSLLNATSVPAVTRLRSPVGPAKSVVSSSDGYTMAAGTESGPVQVWRADGATGFTAARLLTGPSDSIVSLALARSGLLAGGGKDPTVYLWSPTGDTAPVGRATGLTGEVLSVALSPDAGTLAAAGTNGHVYLWDVTDPAHPAALADLVAAEPGFAARGLAFTPDGRVLASGSYDSSVRLWDVSDPARPVPAATLDDPTSRIFAIAISPDGRQLAAGTAAEHNVYRWDITDPRRPVPAGAPLTGPASWINTLDYSPDGRRLAAGSSDNTVWLFTDGSDRNPARLPHPDPVTTASYRPDGTLVTVATDGTLRSWHLPGPVIDAADSVFGIAFGAGGRRLAVGAGAADNSLAVWDVSQPQRPRPDRPPRHNEPGASKYVGTAALTPDGRIYAVGRQDGSLELWDVSRPGTWRRLGSPVMAAGDLAEHVGISHDGRLLALSADDNSVHLFDIGDPARPAPLAVLAGTKPGIIYQTAFSPNAKLLAMASNNHDTYLWDIADPRRPRLTATVRGSAEPIFTTAFSRAGDVLATAGVDKTTRLWDVTDPARPKPLATLTGPVGEVYSVAFSPGRDVLAAGSTDDTVWLWDVRDPRHPGHLATLTGPADAVLGIAFAADGTTLAAGGHDRTVRLWTTDPDLAAAQICATAGYPLTAAEWQQYVPAGAYRPLCP